MGMGKRASWGSDVYHRPDPQADCPDLTVKSNAITGGLLKRDAQIALKKVAALEARVADLEAKCEEMTREVKELQEALHAHANAINAEFLKWHVARIKERG